VVYVNIRYFRYLEKFFSKIIIKFNYLVGSILAILFFFCFAILIVIRIKIATGHEILLEWKFSMLSSLRMQFLIVLDWMALFFFSTVLIITRGVIFFSLRYIIAEKFFRRFILLVLLFVLRIGLLVFRPNFIRILLGWDGLGVTSYLLVIYFQREKSFNAGIITALTNRLGDVGLLALIGLRVPLRRWSFIYFAGLEEKYGLFLVVIMILVAITKRAQIPFSSWLPAAMAAPTPVSSLVHSSTLVTAGVYLIIRLNYLILSVKVLWVLRFLGVVTIFIAGSAALYEIDIKKIIALSTLSQLGLIFFRLGIVLPVIRFFHLITHAYFKAILFICAGSIIHRIKNFQDARLIRKGVFYLPVRFGIFFVSNLRLCGMPFIAGFFSKDLILEMLIINYSRIIIFIFAMISTGLTVIYTLRLANLVFFGQRISEPAFSLVEIDKSIFLGILILLAPSVRGGLWLSWGVLSFRNVIFLPLWIKILVIVVIIIRRTKKNKIFQKPSLKEFFQFMWFIPFMFSRSFSYLGLLSGKGGILLSDYGWRGRMLLFLPQNFFKRFYNYGALALRGNFILRISFFLIFFYLL